MASVSPTLEYREDEVLRITDFYKPWDHQNAFHCLPAKHRLHVGSFGSGKSRPLLMEAIIHCIEYPGSNSIIMRRTMPDLKRTVIDKFENDIPKSLYERGSQERGTFNKSDHIVYFPPVLANDWDPDTDTPIIDPATGEQKKVWKQSKLYFGACDRIEDVGKYLSTEFVFIGFEELGEFPYLIYDALEGRNRCTIHGSRACMAGVTNPMGIGWGWIKKVWVDHQPCHGMDADAFDPNDYQYIHSTVDQNPILIRDKGYIRSLEKSPLRDKVRWGKLETVSGQYFANWREKDRVLPRSAFIFENWQPVWIGWDYGFGHFAVITFWTKAKLKPRFEGEVPRLVNVTLKELVLEETTPENQAKALISAIPHTHDEQEQDTGYLWDVFSVHFSWERFNRTVSNRTVADEIGDILQAAGLPQPTRSNNDRVAGWTKMYSMIDADEWFLLEGECPACVDAIPLLVRGNGVTCSLEDVVKPKGVSLEDDCGDSCLAAGTLVDTARGSVPIEEVTTQDRVLTRKGYRRVFWSGQTGIKPVMRFESLLITPNHPVFLDKQFDTLSSTRLHTCLFTKKKSYLKASHIAGILTPNDCISENTSPEKETERASSSTLKSTRDIMGLFREAKKSIMRTLIRSTIGRITWWHSLIANIELPIVPCVPVSVAGNSSDPAMTATIPIDSTVPQSARLWSQSANVVDESSEEQRESWEALSFAQMPANPNGGATLGLTMWQEIVSTVTSAFPSIGTVLFGFARRVVQVPDHLGDLLPARPVFNLSVEGEEEYFANGILVHNCRYAVAGVLLDEGEKPKEQKLREKLAGIKDPMRRHMEQFREWNLDQARQRKADQPQKVIPTWMQRFKK